MLPAPCCLPCQQRQCHLLVTCWDFTPWVCSFFQNTCNLAPCTRSWATTPKPTGLDTLINYECRLHLGSSKLYGIYNNCIDIIYEHLYNRKCQDYVYVKWEDWCTMWKINHHFRHENKVTTRTTFETPKYPRRPRDQYRAQIVNTLELSAPHQNWGKKTLSNLAISLVKLQTTNTCTYVAAKNGRTVKQSHCETV